MTSAMRQAITVLGAGSWGTALAIQFARTGRHTLLWGRNAGALGDMAERRCNARYLPDARFPDSLIIEASLADALREALDVLVVVPSHAFRGLLLEVSPLLRPDARLAWATKGFELDSGKLPHQVAEEVLGSGVALAVLSGPTFAKEVGSGLPTAMTVAAHDQAFARELATSLSGENFRAYTSDDIIGVEVGAAVKNVLAIGAGISDGLGFGANTRIALITRGAAEMTRLGIALGARAETIMGLAGIGDLVLTCTDDLSRNRRMGLKLAEGKSVAVAQAEIGQVVEGVKAAQAVRQVAQTFGVEMPIAEQVYRVLYEDMSAEKAVRTLMTRQLRSEN